LRQRFAEPDLVALERFLLAYEEERWPTREGPDPPDATGPIDLSMASALALLPGLASNAVPAYTFFWGASGSNGGESLVSAIDSWHRRYGAEPYAA